MLGYQERDPFLVSKKDGVNVVHVSAPSDDLLLDIFDLFQTETFHFVGKKPLQESYCEVVLLPIHEQL